MKILILAGYSKSLVNFRGPLLQELAQSGHEVLACGPEDDRDVERKLEVINVRYCRIPFERTGLNPIKDILLVLRLIKCFRSHCPDIVINYTVKPAIYGSLASRFAGVPSCYSMITGLGYAFTGKNFSARALRRILSLMYNAALRANKAVFFQNPDDLEFFINSNIVARQKTVMVNGSGVDLDYYSAPLPGKKPVFLMIARLLRDKGVAEYVHAARLLKQRYPQAVFQLLGPLDTNPAAITQNELDVWLKEQVVEYLGATDDVRPYIQGASVYVLPSYREGTPRTVLEAMAMSRPIVTTDAPGCRETVKDGFNGFLVPVKNPEELAFAMERFISEPDLILRMGMNSRTIAVDKYDVHRVNSVIIRAIGA